MRLLLAFLLVTPAFGQSFTVKTDSLWSPWATTTTQECVAQLLDVNGDAISSKRAIVGNIFYKQPLLEATFTSYTTSPMSVYGVRLTCNGHGQAGWESSGWINQRLASPFVAPRSVQVRVQYRPGLADADLSFSILKPPPALGIKPPG